MKKTIVTRQVVQSLKTGIAEIADIPCPSVQKGCLLIRTSRSLISAGTEKMIVEFGKANLFEKVRQQPDKVKSVLDKIKTDGLMPTVKSVRSRMEKPLPMGYCNAGEVVEVGEGVAGFTVGDRVVSNGHHADIVCVPQNLCARIPPQVSDEAASFTVLGAIALQGIRLAAPTIGETFVVTGLGLIGLITVQLLKANGCKVLGIDYDKNRLKLAADFGAETVELLKGEDPIEAAAALTGGSGVDGVIITASTKSSEPIHQATLMCRKRGRIVLVGVTGLELSRADFYKKELSFQVSCSYGPGRYDPLYEEGGNDYPIGYVRWTEQRNFGAVLDMLAQGGLDVKPLVTHRFNMEQAGEAYKLLAVSGSSLGIVLEYDDSESVVDNIHEKTLTLKKKEKSASAANKTVPVIGVIGAGNYATQTLIPALKAAGARLKSISSNKGLSGAHAGRKFGFEQCTTDTDALIADPEINTIIIATRHDTHARLFCNALKASKHVFLEKPLAINSSELEEIESTYASTAKSGSVPVLMIGFNRRFAPQIKKMKMLLDAVKEPKSYIMTVNAGYIPPDHWTQNPKIGGGRIIGEGCHFIDLLRFLAGSPIISMQATEMGDAPGVALRNDKVTFTLGFADGSFGTVHYLANGHKSFSKERLEVFCAGRILQLDNFIRMRGYNWPGFKNTKLWRQDKGNAACVKSFIDAIRHSEDSPIPFEEMVEVTKISFEIMKSIQN